MRNHYISAVWWFYFVWCLRPKRLHHNYVDHSMPNTPWRAFWSPRFEFTHLQFADSLCQTTKCWCQRQLLPVSDAKETDWTWDLWICSQRRQPLDHLHVFQLWYYTPVSLHKEVAWCEMSSHWLFKMPKTMILNSTDTLLSRLMLRKQNHNIKPVWELA